MNGWTRPAIFGLLIVAPVLAQENELQFKAELDAEAAIARAQEGLVKAQTLFGDKGFQMPNLDVQALKSNLMALQIQPMRLQQATARGERANLSYDRGTRALDDHQYEEAIRIFDAVINEKSARADGALYWKAYALNRIGRRDEALAAVSALRRDYPNSRWLRDAQALEAEAKQSSGQAVSPGQESNEDIKLMAINSLMNADPDRAMPLLEGILKGNSTPKVKDRALFVLTQNRSPRAQQILADYAKGAGNPDLQMRAIRYLGMSGTTETQQQLMSVYSSSSDAGVKREIIRALMTSRGRDPLFNLAKSEKDEALRGEAISQLGMMRATDQLTQLYAQESSVDNKVRIVHSLFAAGASDKVMELIRTEKEPRVRAEAIRSFAMSPSTSPETLASLYASDGDLKTKREIVNGLQSRDDGRLLVDLARKENDPTMKKYIVERLSTMHTKEATDYMMELLK